MKKPYNKYIWTVDSTVCNLLVPDIQVDRADTQGQSAQELGRPQHVFLVDPFTRLIMACRLSYEETKSEH
jgi:hypothetical protein